MTITTYSRHVGEFPEKWKTVVVNVSIVSSVSRCVQAVGKKLAVVEVCVGKGVARVRAGRRGNQVKQINANKKNKQTK